MGNNTGKFEVTHKDEEVKKENDIQEHDETIKAETVEHTEAAPVAEPKENGDAEVKEGNETTTEEVVAVANEEEQKTDTTEVVENKKKGVLGWLKKISFRKEKKPTKSNETEEKKVEKAEEVEEKKEEETPAEVTVKEVVEKTEETTPVEKLEEVATIHEEPVEKSEELR